MKMLLIIDEVTICGFANLFRDFCMNSNSSVWVNAFSLFGYFGGMVVIVGVLLEGSELLVKWVKKKRFRKAFSERVSEEWLKRLIICVKFIKPKILRFETLGFVLMVVGLVVELAGSGTAERMQSKENSELEATNKLISLRVVELTSTNLDLAKQVNETETQLANAQARLNESETNFEMLFAPMNFGEEASFVSDLKPSSGMQVELRCVSDFRAQRTAALLSQRLSAAGWTIINKSNMDDIGVDGIVIGSYADTKSQFAANLLFNALKKRNVEPEMTVNVDGLPPNCIIIAVCPPFDPVQAKAITFNN